MKITSMNKRLLIDVARFKAALPVLTTSGGKRSDSYFTKNAVAVKKSTTSTASVRISVSILD